MMSLGRLGFARWVSDVPSGGNRYDDEVAAGLAELGVDVATYTVDGPWPLVDESRRRRFAETLTAEADWLVDNILAAGAPEAVYAARAAGRRVTLLVHYFPADELGWTTAERDRLTAAEAEALAAATGTIATSRWTAGQVQARYGVTRTAVAVPGVEPTRLATGSPPGTPAQLLWLGRITRTKDPLTLVRALARLDDLAWTARVVGPGAIDPWYTRQVQAEVDRANLADRVGLLGSRTGSDLEAEWDSTDLLVLTSRVEPYGMVVTEALARGIPSLVTSGTGAVEAQGAGGGVFPVGDDEALAAMLRRWLTDPELRQQWRAAAERQRSHLPTWRSTAAAVLTSLTSASGPASAPAAPAVRPARPPRTRPGPTG